MSLGCWIYHAYVFFHLNHFVARKLSVPLLLRKPLSRRARRDSTLLLLITIPRSLSSRLRCKWLFYTLFFRIYVESRVAFGIPNSGHFSRRIHFFGRFFTFSREVTYNMQSTADIVSRTYLTRLYIIVLGYQLGNSMMLTMIPYIANSLHANNREYGLAFTLYYITQFISTLTRKCAYL